METGGDHYSYRLVGDQLEALLTSKIDEKKANIVKMISSMDCKCCGDGYGRKFFDSGRSSDLYSLTDQRAHHTTDPRSMTNPITHPSFARDPNSVTDSPTNLRPNTGKYPSQPTRAVQSPNIITHSIANPRNNSNFATELHETNECSNNDAHVTADSDFFTKLISDPCSNIDQFSTSDPLYVSLFDEAQRSDSSPFVQCHPSLIGFFIRRLSSIATLLINDNISAADESADSIDPHNRNAATKPRDVNEGDLCEATAILSLASDYVSDASISADMTEMRYHSSARTVRARLDLVLNDINILLNSNVYTESFFRVKLDHGEGCASPGNRNNSASVSRVGVITFQTTKLNENTSELYDPERMYETNFKTRNYKLSSNSAPIDAIKLSAADARHSENQRRNIPDSNATGTSKLWNNYIDTDACTDESSAKFSEVTAENLSYSLSKLRVSFIKTLIISETCGSTKRALAFLQLVRDTSLLVNELLCRRAPRAAMPRSPRSSGFVGVSIDRLDLAAAFHRLISKKPLIMTSYMSSDAMSTIKEASSSNEARRNRLTVSLEQVSQSSSDVAGGNKPLLGRPCTETYLQQGQVAFGPHPSDSWGESIGNSPKPVNNQTDISAISPLVDAEKANSTDSWGESVEHSPRKVVENQSQIPITFDRPVLHSERANFTDSCGKTIDCTANESQAFADCSSLAEHQAYSTIADELNQNSACYNDQNVIFCTNKSQLTTITFSPHNLNQTTLSSDIEQNASNYLIRYKRAVDTVLELIDVLLAAAYSDSSQSNQPVKFDWSKETTSLSPKLLLATSEKLGDCVENAFALAEQMAYMKQEKITLYEEIDCRLLVERLISTTPLSPDVNTSFTSTLFKTARMSSTNDDDWPTKIPGNRNHVKPTTVPVENQPAPSLKHKPSAGTLDPQSSTTVEYNANHMRHPLINQSLTSTDSELRKDQQSINFAVQNVAEGINNDLSQGMKGKYDARELKTRSPEEEDDDVIAIVSENGNGDGANKRQKDKKDVISRCAMSLKTSKHVGQSSPRVTPNGTVEFGHSKSVSYLKNVQHKFNDFKDWLLCILLLVCVICYAVLMRTGNLLMTFFFGRAGLFFMILSALVFWYYVENDMYRRNFSPPI